MKSGTDNFERRDKIIAALLWYGTWFATALIAVGVVLTVLEYVPTFLPLALTGYGAVKAGIALLILLPVARVALMLALFLCERDYAYSLIAALVLAIIAAGVIVEM